MTKVTSIKNIDPDIFREFKAEAVREGVPVGKLFNVACAQFLEQKKSKKKRSFLDLKPISYGPGTEHVSEEVDEILYGSH